MLYWQCILLVNAVTAAVNAAVTADTSNQINLY